jgi:hypothetical protein
MLPAKSCTIFHLIHSMQPRRAVYEQYEREAILRCLRLAGKLRQEVQRV